MSSQPSGTSNRGFASMDPARQKEIASKGGKSVPPEHRSFSRNHELASRAGRKGGEASHGGGRNKSSAPGGGNVVQQPREQQKPAAAQSQSQEGEDQSSGEQEHHEEP